MSTSHEESARDEELTGTRAGEARLGEREQQRGPSARRRDILAKSLGVAAAAVGAGAVLDLSAGTAQASSTKAGVFASSTAGTPTVKATGTNGADGVDASSDSSTAVSAVSGSGTGLAATSSSGLAGHFSGDVQMDNSLTVTGLASGFRQ